jgi:hypothetical protein
MHRINWRISCLKPFFAYPYRHLSDHTDLPCEVLTSLLIRGIQMREMSTLCLLIGLVKHFILDNLFISYSCCYFQLFNFVNPNVIKMHLDCLIGLVKHAVWAAFLYFVCLLLLCAFFKFGN